LKILVVGGGAREHTLAWKLAQSPKVKEIYAAPGNAGTAQIAANLNLKADDIEGLALVRKSIGIPVEADESVRNLSDVLSIIKLGAADFVSLKPFKFGGFRPMRKILTLCEAANIKCLVGTTPGSSLIDAANVHFITSSPSIDSPCEIGESFRMQNDPVTGLKIINGFANILYGPGIGINLELEALGEA